MISSKHARLAFTEMSAEALRDQHVGFLPPKHPQCSCLQLSKVPRPLDEFQCVNELAAMSPFCVLDLNFGLNCISKPKSSLNRKTFSLALAPSFFPWIQLFIGCILRDLMHGLAEAYVAFTRTGPEAEIQLC